MHPVVAIAASISARRLSFPSPIVLRHSFALEDTSLYFGTYCECPDINFAQKPQLLAELQAEIEKVVAEELLVSIEHMPHSECISAFNSGKNLASASLVTCTGNLSYRCWRVGQQIDLLPPEVPLLNFLTPEKTLVAGKEMNTRDAKGAMVIPHNNGFLMRTADLPPPQLAQFQTIGAAANGSVNLGDIVMESSSQAAGGRTFIQSGEMSFDRSILQCVRVISTRPEGLRLVLISGPSASGKTTFAAKLALALRATGLEPVVLSTDDYYKDLRNEDYPRTAAGALNHEVVAALRLQQLNADMTALFGGAAVDTPIFDMVLGRPSEKVRRLQMTPKSILLMEGIFALDPQLSKSFAPNHVFKVFIVPIPCVQIDEHTSLSNQAIRLLRRISRDFLHRGRDAAASIRRMRAVQAGEEAIFSTAQFADFVMNSFLKHEVAILSVPLIPLLRAVGPTSPEYTCARSLLALVSDVIVPLSETTLPESSLIREFIGGSAFEKEPEVQQPVHHVASFLAAFNPAKIFDDASARVASLKKNLDVISDPSAVLAIVNDGEVLPLKLPVRLDCTTIAGLPLSSREGVEAITASGIVMLHAAVRKVLSGQLVVQHGFIDEASPRSSCMHAIVLSSTRTVVEVTPEACGAVALLMREWIAQAAPIEIAEVPTRQAMDLFSFEKMPMTTALLETTRTPFVHIAQFQGVFSLLVDPLLPDVRHVDFKLETFARGFSICFPVLDSNNSLTIRGPSPQTPAAFAAYKHRSVAISAHGLSCIGDVNGAIFSGTTAEMIRVSESLLSKQLFDLVNHIQQAKVRVILVAGNSGSGKSVVCEQIGDQLKMSVAYANRRRQSQGAPAAADVGTVVSSLSLDNYYKDITDPTYPRNPDGSLDFEDVSALRLELLQSAMDKLLRQHLAISVDVFDCGAGKMTTDALHVEPPNADHGVLIVEGIFALTAPVVALFKTFGCVLQVIVQPMCIVNLDELHYVPNQKLLVLRRIVRDIMHRGRECRETLTMWEGVVAGEDKNWLPVLTQADVIFNAHCVYELGALKEISEMQLRRVDPSFRNEYKDAMQLLSLLKWVHPVPEGKIPKHTIAQELLDQT